MLDESQLINKTTQYWDFECPDPKQPYEPGTGYSWYIQELLPREMEYAGSKGRLPKERYENLLLVLLVGHSLEPLLQTVWAYKPAKVLLIINQDYGIREGKAQENLVKWAIKQIRPASKIIGQERFVTEATPAGIFGNLSQDEDVKVHLQEDNPIVVDITGAKKSMMAGAFLFAAFANVPVSYVDFDDDKYDPERGRPYGYACRIRPFNNPYERFSLRDWEQVRNLYNRYKFRDARLLLAGTYDDKSGYLAENGRQKTDDGELGVVWRSMKKVLPSSEPLIRKLADILRGYEAWDSGNYPDSIRIFKDIDAFQPPSGVEIIGENWYVPSEGEFKNQLDDFYVETPLFYSYIYDELSRIRRMIEKNRDYRSAILRAGSLNEIVMLARLVKIMPEGSEKESWLSALQSKTPSGREVFGFLKRSPGKYDLKKHVWSNRADLPDIVITIKEQMRWHKKIEVFHKSRKGAWRTFIYRRNDLAHKYFAPPREWAEDAFNFIKANIVDFSGTEPPWEDTEALSWSKLCEFTGLKAFLSPNLT